jgi:hypothetical protein
MWDECAAVTHSGDYYRGRREALGLSKAEVARRMDAISMEFLSERACNRCVSELEADKRRFVECQKLEALHEVLGMEPPDPRDINLSDRWVGGSEGKRLPTVIALSVFDSEVHNAFGRYRREILEEAEREGLFGNRGGRVSRCVAYRQAVDWSQTPSAPATADTIRGHDRERGSR